jgi:hypothetical protein
MAIVVNCRPAGIHADLVVLQRLKILDTAGHRVVKA